MNPGEMGGGGTGGPGQPQPTIPPTNQKKVQSVEGGQTKLEADLPAQTFFGPLTPKDCCAATERLGKQKRLIDGLSIQKQKRKIHPGCDVSLVWEHAYEM